MPIEYEIIEIFEITGRGVVVLLAETTEREVRKTHRVEVITPDGIVVSTDAYKQYMSRRQPTPVEKEVFLLKGLHKAGIPVGSRLRFLE